MKIIFLLLIGIVVHAAAYSQVSKKTDWHEMNLKGKVKSIRENCFKAKRVSGEIQKGKKEAENNDGTDPYTVFNNDGKKIEVDEFTSDGKIYKKKTYVYEKGIESEVSFYNADGVLASKNKYINTYDAKDNPITRVHLKGDSSVDNKYTFVYDSSGDLIEYNWFKPDGNLGSKNAMQYDDKGNIIEEVEYNPDGKIDWKFDYKNDEKGNRIEENIYKGEKFIIKYTNAYDQYGNETEIDWCKKSGKIYRKYFQKYEYDSHGNWMKQTLFKKNKPKYILERELTYFSP